jgi:Zinc carboxypeptidase
MNITKVCMIWLTFQSQAHHALRWQIFCLDNSARVQLTLRPLISGGSDDWAKEKAGIKYAYTVELPDDGRHGFVLPASQIEPTGQEVWEGVKNMMNYYSKNLKN